MTKYLAPSDSMVVFANTVNAILEEREISKSQLARDCGLSLRSIQGLLNGKHGSCTFATADKIAAALGTTVAELLQG